MSITRKRCIVLFAALVIFSGVVALAAPARAHAAQTRYTVQVGCVVDNREDIPASLASTTFAYSIKYFDSYRYRQVGRQSSFLYPDSKGPVNFSLSDGNTTTATFSYRSNPVLMFEPASSSSDRFALSSIELVSGAERYTYDNDGDASVPCTPFNWAKMTGTACNIVLHFTYVKDLQPKQYDYDIALSGSKQIDYLGDGVANPDTSRNGSNDYRLYLDASTGQETQDNYKSKNIIFIVDVSGSMETQLGSSTRLDVLKKSAQRMLNELSADPNNTYSVVPFAGGGSTEIRVRKGTAEQAANAINGLRANGGTAYYEALTKVSDLLQDDVRESVIVFLTDGEPTDVGTSVIGGPGGYTDQAPIAAPYAAMAAEGLSGCDSLYTVYTGNSSSAATWAQIITQKVQVADEKFSVNATNQEEFELVINQLTTRLQKPQTHIEIKDTLSDNVAYRTGSDKVVKTAADGTTSVLTRGVDYSLSYDSSTRSVTATINEKVQENTSYVLSFDVATSVAAVKKWLADGAYPDVGDIDTDYVQTGNATSSGQPGFYSNTSATAAVVWDGGRKSTDLGKPVIQVSFNADTNAAIKAHVRLYNMELSKNMFLYELIDDTGSAVSLAGNNLDGDIFFPDLGFDTEGEWDFTIKPMVPNAGDSGWIEHMEYDSTEVKVHVKASVSGDSSGAADQMNLDVTYDKEPKFYCEYSLRKTQQ